MKKLLASPLAEKKLAADFAEATGHPRFFSAPVFHFSAKSASIPRKWRSSFRRRPDSPTFDFQSSEEIIEIHVQLPLSRFKNLQTNQSSNFLS